MANQVVPRLKGDDYQHLMSWLYVLTLKMPDKKVRKVGVEDDSAFSVDDVTVYHEPDTDLPNQFYQIKYHVDHRQHYSTDVLLKKKTPNSTSRLQKFFKTWQKLREAEPYRPIELYLLSNWGWDSNDPIGKCISGDDNSLKEAFFQVTERSDIGILRERWRSELNADSEDFERFARTLRLRIGADNTDELTGRVIERMQHHQLKTDDGSILLVVGIIRKWIESGRQYITLEALEDRLEQFDLYEPDNRENSVTLYLTTVKAHRFEIEPDYHLDWRDYFEEISTQIRGTELKEPANWNRVLLPELENLEDQINQEIGCRLIRARGRARLSAWFAFGYTFSEVARYIIEVNQQGHLWRTDALPTPDFTLSVSSRNGAPEGELLDGTGETVAVGISVTGSLDEDVRAYLSGRTEQVAALLLLRPQCGPENDCLRNAGDVVALAVDAKNQVRTFVQKWQARRLLLFYFGPLSGACFIGHRLNAVCREIQIMEAQPPGYAPSFVLR